MELWKEGRKHSVPFWAVQWDHAKLSFRTISECECCLSVCLSQVRVGGRCLRRLRWKPWMTKGEICVQAKETWAGLWNSFSSECVERKSSTKKLKFQFLLIESMFSYFVVVFIFGSWGVLFVSLFFKSCQTTMLWPWASLWRDKKNPEHNQEFQAVSGANKMFPSALTKQVFLVFKTLGKNCPEVHFPKAGSVSRMTWTVPQKSVVQSLSCSLLPVWMPG